MDLPQPQPLHMQIRALLLREIMAGRLSDGTKLPPERDMAIELKTSVGTLRKALDSLTEMGLLDRVQGSGNYVRAPDDVAGIYAFFRLELASGGGVPSAQVLSVDKAPLPAELPPLETDQDAFRIRRLRLLNDVPVALEDIWLEGHCASQITAEDLSDSLYQFYKSQLGLWIARAEDYVGLANWPEWSQHSGPCGYVLRAGWAQDGRRVEASQTWFDAGLARYVNRMT